jgi:hypothetical protein
LSACKLPLLCPTRRQSLRARRLAYYCFEFCCRCVTCVPRSPRRASLSRRACVC